MFYTNHNTFSIISYFLQDPPQYFVATNLSPHSFSIHLIIQQICCNNLLKFYLILIGCVQLWWDKEIDGTCNMHIFCEFGSVIYLLICRCRDLLSSCGIGRYLTFFIYSILVHLMGRNHRISLLINQTEEESIEVKPLFNFLEKKFLFLFFIHQLEYLRFKSLVLSVEVALW